MSTTERTRGLHVSFVCTGNICRSPMAQNIFRAAIDQAGLSEQVHVTSCGIGGWHEGEPADSRAQHELISAGYSEQHIAAQLSQVHREADLFVAMDHSHMQALRRLGLGDRTRLLRSFDPQSEPDAQVDDPYYGSDDGFARVRAEIEAAVPGLLDWVQQRLP